MPGEVSRHQSALVRPGGFVGARPSRRGQEWRPPDTPAGSSRDRRRSRAARRPPRSRRWTLPGSRRPRPRSRYPRRSCRRTPPMPDGYQAVADPAAGAAVSAALAEMPPPAVATGPDGPPPAAPRSAVAPAPRTRPRSLPPRSLGTGRRPGHAVARRPRTRRGGPGRRGTGRRPGGVTAAPAAPAEFAAHRVAGAGRRRAGRCRDRRQRGVRRGVLPRRPPRRARTTTTSTCTDLLATVLERGASDLHLTSGSRPAAAAQRRTSARWRSSPS